MVKTVAQKFLTPCVKILQLRPFLFVNPAKPSMFATIILFSHIMA